MHNASSIAFDDGYAADDRLRLHASTRRATHMDTRIAPCVNVLFRYGWIQQPETSPIEKPSWISHLEPRRPYLHCWDPQTSDRTACPTLGRTDKEAGLTTASCLEDRHIASSSVAVAAPRGKLSLDANFVTRKFTPYSQMQHKHPRYRLATPNICLAHGGARRCNAIHQI